MFFCHAEIAEIRRKYFSLVKKRELWIILFREFLRFQREYYISKELKVIDYSMNGIIKNVVNIKVY